jgi:hypothetical protein
LPWWARRLIVIGWAIPLTDCVALLLSRHWLAAAGKFAGAFVLMLFGVPSFLAALALFTAGTLGGLRALRQSAPFSRGDYAVLLAGAIGTGAGVFVLGGFIYGAVRYP